MNKNINGYKTHVCKDKNMWTWTCSLWLRKKSIFADAVLHGMNFDTMQDAIDNMNKNLKRLGITKKTPIIP